MTQTVNCLCNVWVEHSRVITVWVTYVPELAFGALTVQWHCVDICSLLERLFSRILLSCLPAAQEERVRLELNLVFEFPVYTKKCSLHPTWNDFFCAGCFFHNFNYHFCSTQAPFCPKFSVWKILKPFWNWVSSCLSLLMVRKRSPVQLIKLVSGTPWAQGGTSISQWVSDRHSQWPFQTCQDTGHRTQSVPCAISKGEIDPWPQIPEHKIVLAFWDCWSFSNDSGVISVIQSKRKQNPWLCVCVCGGWLFFTKSLTEYHVERERQTEREREALQLPWGTLKTTTSLLGIHFCSRKTQSQRLQSEATLDKDTLN